MAKFITDDRMLKVMDYVLTNSINGISSQVEFCSSIGFVANNINNIRTGKQSFSHEHIRACCKNYNVSANYIYGLTNQMFRAEKKSNPIAAIRAALMEIEANQNKKH